MPGQLWQHEEQGQGATGVAVAMQGFRENIVFSPEETWSHGGI